MNRTISAALLAASLGSLAPFAQAQHATYRCGPSTNSVPAQVSVGIDAAVVNVPIPPQTPATPKRDMIKGGLIGQGYSVLTDGPLGHSGTILNMSGHTVSMATGSTGELDDGLVATAAPGGSIGYAGHFDPFDQFHLPAVFTAGWVTDVGELSVQVSAQELNFQTDGPIICQALFQRLAPRAPQYGAQINYAGDRLEVYFDPAYTNFQGGVLFGTNSRSPGCAGSLIIPPVPPRAVLSVDGSTAPIIQTELVELSLVSVYPIPVPPVSPPAAVRDAVKNTLTAAGVDAVSGPDAPSVTLRNINILNNIIVSPGATGQDSSTLRAGGAKSGRVDFDSHFNPLAYSNQPAMFTAGIVTDVGILREQVSAQELNFQTDGPIICQALFQRLAPRAPQYGAQINYAGDRLEVYFDPAYTVTQGGIIFGTTSPSPGCSAVLSFRTLCRADWDGDGVVTPADLGSFVNVWLTSLQQGTLAGDFDGNGIVQPADIGVYVSSWFAALINGC